LKPSIRNDTLAAMDQPRRLSSTLTRSAMMSASGSLNEFSGSSIWVEPIAGGRPNELVDASWHVEEKTYRPSTSDEIRLLTSSGVVVSRVFLDSTDAVRQDSCPCNSANLNRGTVQIRCPPFPGGYLVGFVEAASGKRVLSAPFRVLGDAFTPPIVVKVNREVAPPLTAMSASFKWGDVLAVVNKYFGDGKAKMKGVAVAVAEFDVPHNDGYIGGRNGFGDCAHVSIVARPTSIAAEMLAETVEFPSPRKAAVYNVRILATPLSGVPVVIAMSSTFAVDDKLPPEIPSSRTIINPTKTVCYVTEPLEVSYALGCGDSDVKPLQLTALDHVRFFPVGRSEQDRFAGKLDLCVGRVTLGATIKCVAPPVEGCFDVAFRRFLDNETIGLCRQTITTKLPDAVVEVLPNADAMSNPVCHIRIRCEAPHFITASDRVHAYDETANMVQCVVVKVEDPHVAEAWLYIGVSGKCNVKYFSSRAGYEMPWRSNQLITTSVTATTPLPTASIIVLHTIPTTSPVINVLFEKADPADQRDPDVQRRDVLAIFAEHTNESACTQWADDPDAMPAVHVVYLRGRDEAEVQFPTEGLSPGPYVIRYMVCLPHRPESTEPGGSRLIASSECSLHVVDPHSSEMLGRAKRFAAVASDEKFKSSAAAAALSSSTMGGQGQQYDDDPITAVVPMTLEQASAAELAVTRHRHKARNMLAGRGRPTGLSSKSSSYGSPAGSPRRQSGRRGSIAGLSPLMLVRRLSTMPMEQAKTSLMGTRRSSNAYTSLTKRSKADSLAAGLAVPLRLEGSGYEGAVLGPKYGSTEDVVLVTVHLMQGQPRSDDLIILLNDDCTRILSELPMGLAHSQASEGTLCTALLNPPKFPGKYIAGYYSQKVHAVVLVSDRIRIKAGTGEKQQPRHGSIPGSGDTPVLSPKSKSLKPLDGSSRVSPTNSRPSGPQFTPTARFLHTGPIPLTPKTTTAASGAKAWDISRDFLRAQGFSANHHPAVRLHSIARAVSDPPRFRALIVGCTYFKEAHELGGPSNDVLAMDNVLRNYCGIDGKDIVTLSESSTYGPDFHPTAANVRRGIRWLTHECRGGDHLLFYFSGCGARIAPPQALLDLTTDWDNALLPTDTDFGHRSITYKELAATIYKVVPGTAAVTLLIDACFTSTALDAYELRVGGDTSATVLPAGVTSLRQQRCRLEVPERGKWRCAIPPLPVPLTTPGRDASAWDAYQPTVTRHGLRHLLTAPETQLDDSPLDAMIPTTPEGGGDRSSLINWSFSHERGTTEPIERTLTMKRALGVDDVPEHGRFTLFEATRERQDTHCGAWDVFLRDEGCTMGLFTYAIGQVLCQTALERGNDGRVTQELCWHEFESRVKRLTRQQPGGAFQLPLASYGDRAQQARPVFPLSVNTDDG
jgi:hypothetical protein